LIFERPLLLRWLFVFLPSSFASFLVAADLTVIYDSGATKPLAPLLSPFNVEKPSSHEKPAGYPGNLDRKRPEIDAIAPHLGPADLANVLPLRSLGLRVGAVVTSKLRPDVQDRLAQGNPRPFFLIGSDPASLQWLSNNRSTLHALGAVGMLIQADTEEDLRRVAQIAQGLSITLGSASDLASALGIEHYPVLITREGITQ
jgi:integrating conjugative element protein (TIGR03765 family)